MRFPKKLSLKKGMKKITEDPVKVVSVVFIAAMLVITFAPILLIVIFSFSTSKSIGNWSNLKFSVQPFVDLFADEKAMTALRNSLVLGFVASLLATIIGTFSAIGLFNLKRKSRAALEYSGQITMFNADIVTALAMLVFFVFIKVQNDWVRLIIAHTVICLPYVVMSILPRLSQLDPNVYEAGLDLGASPMRTLLTVILPQLVGGMLAGFALAFTISMDDFTLSVFVTSSVNTIPSMLYAGLRAKGITNSIRALSTVLLVGIMIMLIVINVVSSLRRKKQAKQALKMR